MIVSELFEDTGLKTRLMAVVAQIRSRREDTGADKPMTTRALLNLLKKNDISVSREDLFDMIQKAPLKNLIDNIEGDEVKFRGERGTAEPKTDKTADKLDKTLDKMADRAAGL